jgi:predicted AAA+ superfamily ATPase
MSLGKHRSGPCRLRGGVRFGEPASYAPWDDCRTRSTQRMVSTTIDSTDAAAILEVARSWSFWDRPPAPSVARRVALPNALRPSLALVVQGVRRCGKSTLMRQLIDRYELDPAHCLFMNCEDPRLAPSLTWETLEAAVTSFRAMHPRAKTLTFCIDEIQNVAGWERWLRSHLDRPSGMQFVVTGSNAAMLSGELGSVLTGRHRTVELFPFDLAEFRDARPGASVQDFLRAGGFPEPIQLEDGDELLRQYFQDIVERDVRERLGARSSRPVRQVAQMAYESAGSELSARRIAAATGLAVDTVTSYLEACEAAYLLFGVPFFAHSERKRAAYNRKYYPVDTGLRCAVISSTGADLGKSLECAVFLELRRRYRDVFYWRGDGEVDFVVQDGKRIVPIQVTLEALEPRHERALASFYEAFPHADEAVTVTAASFEHLAV